MFKLNQDDDIKDKVLQTLIDHLDGKVAGSKFKKPEMPPPDADDPQIPGTEQPPEEVDQDSEIMRLMSEADDDEDDAPKRK